ncbi:MAG: acyl carrier protein phosphodiesterase [Bermanella sp.]
MNWLAHIFLSEYNIESQLGNLLNDACKGRAWPGASNQLKQGMQIHQQVDAFTDAHENFKKSKLLLGRGHLRGVVVDLSFDLLLTRHWHRYSLVDRNVFLDDFYRQSKQAIKPYPAGVQRFVNGLIQSDHLRNYQSLDDLEKTFARVDKRLSARLLKKESTHMYFPLVKKEINALEQNFLSFFPELLTHVKSSSNPDQLTHWK